MNSRRTMNIEIWKNTSKWPDKNQWLDLFPLYGRRFGLHDYSQVNNSVPIIPYFCSIPSSGWPFLTWSFQRSVGLALYPQIISETFRVCVYLSIRTSDYVSKLPSLHTLDNVNVAVYLTRWAVISAAAFAVAKAQKKNIYQKYYAKSKTLHVD